MTFECMKEIVFVALRVIFNNIRFWYIRIKNINLRNLILSHMDKSIHSHLYHQVVARLRSKREEKGVTQTQLAEC